MPKAKRSSRRPIFRQKFGGITITVQRCKKAGYEAQAIMRKDGKAIRQRYLATEGEAKALADAWVIESGNTGAKAAAAISEADKRFLMEAKESLASFGKSLPDALAFYLTHLRSTHSSKPVREVVDALLLHRQRKGKSSRYQNDLRVRLQRFEKQFGDRHIAEISREEVEAWLDSLTVAPVTYNNFRRLLHVLWAFALDKQWARENVVSRIEAQTVKTERPGILTIAQTRALLNLSAESCLPSRCSEGFGMRS
jgi:predicted translin family RNA/ssDNA-binding protein